MNDLFGSETPIQAPSDKVVVDGQTVVTRTSMAKAIEVRARTKSISQDEAWTQISQEILAFHSGNKKIPERIAGSSPKPEVVDKRHNEESSAPFFVKKKGAFFLNFNSNTLDEVTDDLLPDELRRMGITSVMEGLSSGRIKIDGENQMADLLAQTLSRSDDPNDPSYQRALEAKNKILLQRPQMQYPLLRQNVRVMPSDFNRTSLFHVGSNNLPRRFCKNEKLGQIGTGVTIYYHGEELRQTDEAIFRQLVYLARGQRPWEAISLSQCPFIRDAKGAKRRLGAKDLKEVNDILLRLRSALLLIKTRKRGFITCNLIKDYDGNGVDRFLVIDPRVAMLFDSYAAIEVKMLSSLSAVAAKIYSYLATVPVTGLYPILVSNFFEFCYGGIEYLEKEYLRRNPVQKSGQPSTKRDAELSVQKKLSDFKRKMLPAALDELKKENLVATWEWKDKCTKVAIVKNPETNAQVTEATTEDQQDT